MTKHFLWKFFRLKGLLYSPAFSFSPYFFLSRIWIGWVSSTVMTKFFMSKPLRRCSAAVIFFTHLFWRRPISKTHPFLLAGGVFLQNFWHQLVLRASGIRAFCRFNSGFNRDSGSAVLGTQSGNLKRFFTFDNATFCPSCAECGSWYGLQFFIILACLSRAGEWFVAHWLWAGFDQRFVGDHKGLNRFCGRRHCS